MSETKKELWGIEVIGPDDWFAARSLQHAREMAMEINKGVMRHPADSIAPNVWAVPRFLELWTEEEHAASLAATEAALSRARGENGQ